MKKTMQFRETTARRNRVFTGKAVHFSADEIILPDGKRATREYMEHPGAVAVIPFVNAREIVLVKQYRYPVRELTYELPAGKLDPDESAAACVRRELEEETGYRARKIKKLLSFWPTPAFSDEIIHIFAARDLVASQRSPDEDEFIEHVVLPVRDVLAMIRRGRIQDSKTLIALLYWAHYGAPTGF